jgi:hypothetical protein
MAAQQSEGRADEEQFVPDSQDVSSEEQPGNASRIGCRGPVLVDAGRDHVHGKQEPTKDHNGHEVAKLEFGPAFAGPYRKTDGVITVDESRNEVGEQDRGRERCAH